MLFHSDRRRKAKLSHSINPWMGW